MSFSRYKKMMQDEKRTKKAEKKEKMCIERQIKRENKNNEANDKELES